MPIWDRNKYVDADFLRSIEACSGEIEHFEEIFPYERVRFTRENAEQAIGEGLDMWFFLWSIVRHKELFQCRTAVSEMERKEPYLCLGDHLTPADLIHELPSMPASEQE